MTGKKKDPKRVKAGKMSRTKGQTYERKIQKILNFKLDLNLVRNLEQNRRDLHGDLVDEKTQQGPVVNGEQVFIECKNRPDAISWPELFANNPKAPLHQWLEVAVNLAETPNVWLFFKSGKRDFVAFYPQKFPDWNIPYFKNGTICITLLEDFLEWLTN